MSEALVSYFNQATMISILVPDGWEGTQLSDKKFRIFAPPIASLDGHRPSISFERTKMNQRGKEAFMQVADHYLDTMKQGMPQFTLLNEDAFQLSSAGALVILREFSWVDADDTGNDYTQFQAFVLYLSNIVFIVNGATRTPSADVLPTLKQILYSMRIIPDA
ncbi:MAG: hypothetical protein AAFR81_08295 [Chloroflexota bacterium]